MLEREGRTSDTGWWKGSTPLDFRPKKKISQAEAEAFCVLLAEKKRIDEEREPERLGGVASV